MALMVSRKWSWLWLGWILVAFPAWGEEFKVVQVQGEIYSLIALDDSSGNSTFVVTEEGVLVIDTGNGPAQAREILRQIRKVTDKPIRLVINTGANGEHVFGNSEFRSLAPVLAHKDVRDEILSSRGAREFERLKSRGAEGLKAAEVATPNVLFEGVVELAFGKYLVQLIPPSRAGFGGDTAVYLKNFRVIVAGDLVFNKTYPDLSSAHVDEWIDTLQKLEGLDAELIVPGHGDAGDKPLLIFMKHYLMRLRGLVNQQLVRDVSEDDALEAIRPAMLEMFPGWKRPELLDDGIRRVYRDYKLRAQKNPPKHTLLPGGAFSSLDKG